MTICFHIQREVISYITTDIFRVRFIKLSTRSLYSDLFQNVDHNVEQRET